MGHAVLAAPLTQGASGTEELWTPRMLVPVCGGSDPQQVSGRELGFRHVCAGELDGDGTCGTKGGRYQRTRMRLEPRGQISGRSSLRFTNEQTRPRGVESAA